MLTEGAADLGAMFVGATHARLRALIARLGLGGVRPLPARGAKVVVTAGGRKEFAPEEVSAMVLSKMRTVAEEYLGKPVK